MGIAGRCRGAMGIAGAVRALSPAFRTRVVGRRAQVGPLQRPSLIFVTRPQAAFRTSTGSGGPGRKDGFEPLEAAYPVTLRTSRFARRRPTSSCLESRTTAL